MRIKPTQEHCTERWREEGRGEEGKGGSKREREREDRSGGERLRDSLQVCLKLF